MEQPSDLKVIKAFFFANATTAETLAEWKNLPKSDREALAEGIRDGSFDYA